MGARIALGIIVLVSIGISVFGQKTDYLYDYNIDYFPRAQTLKHDTLSTTLVANGYQGEFIETLEFVTNTILGKETFVTRIPGFKMMSSGICPTQIRAAEKWIKIEIDKEGTLKEVEVYQNAVQVNESLSNQFLMMLQMAKIKPAMKDGKSVNVRLYYIIETK